MIGSKEYNASLKGSGGQLLWSGPARLFDLIKAVQPYSANRPYKCVSDLVAIPILMIRLSRDDFMVSSARIPL